MKSRDWPVVKQNVPDPYKWHAILDKIWFAEHGFPDVTITYEDPKKDDKDEAST